MLPPDRVRLSSGAMTVDIDMALGGRARSWTVDAMELLAVNGPDPVEHGMYAMAPWAGRLRGNAVPTPTGEHALPVTYGPWALHGTVLARPAQIIHHGRDGDTDEVLMRFVDHPGWPWEMTVDACWRLEPTKLVTSLTVLSHAESFPAVVGWHPWFRRRLARGGPAQWSMRATSRLQRGADALPTGERAAFDPSDGPFDDAFHVPDGGAALDWPGALTLDIASTGDWYVIYDQPADCLCVEPQSGPPDGLRGPDATQVTPDSPLTLVVDWSIAR